MNTIWFEKQKPFKKEKWQLNHRSDNQAGGKNKTKQNKTKQNKSVG